MPSICRMSVGVHMLRRKHAACSEPARWRPAVKQLALIFGFAFAAAAAPSDIVERGEYVFRAAGCAACHTDPESNAFLAGGRALETPFGTFYSPNITPHAENGIGSWSADDFWRALSEGQAPDGRHYYPVFPFASYTRMRRSDSDLLFAYLRSVAASPKRNREHDLPWYMRWRFANALWKWLFLDAERLTPDPSRSEQSNRGAYVVEALAHCGECHTPRNRFGALVRERWLAGSADGPNGDPVPNITPHPEAGIGGWGVADIAEYLASGMDPDFDFAGGAMAEVVEESTSHLSGEDRQAVAVYLKSLKPLP